MSQGKLSFTIRRPTPTGSPQASQPSSRSGSDLEPPPSRPTNGSRPVPPAIARAKASFSSGPSPLAGAKRRFAAADADSSEEERTEDEIITGFDELGVERCASSNTSPRMGRNSPQASFRAAKPRHAPPAPLVIAPLANRDWRHSSYAKRHVSDRFLPPGARERAAAEKAGEVDTKDTINSGPQLAGLTLAAPKVDAVEVEESAEVKAEPDGTTIEVKMEEEESLEQRALRALLTGEDDTPQIAAIPMHVPSETEAYMEDVETRPDTPTMDDYARVPIEQFGAALLRGMGWKEGQAASRKRTGMAEPWVPKARPAFLGLGAKARPEDTVHEDDKPKGRKAAMKYVPLVKRVAEARAIPLLTLHHVLIAYVQVRANGERSGSSSARSSDDEGRQVSRVDRGDRDRADRDGDRNSRRDRDSDPGRTRDRDSDRNRDRRGEEGDGKYSDREDRRDRDRDRPNSGRDSDRPRDNRRDRDRDYRDKDRDRNGRRTDDRDRDRRR
ncbi:hypothetical protein CALVIDRAFT_377395 [Calocera viscosa TUFC12733]|uniref:G-patch domain-containing protein n=1 Tax=Calocera viscosa (strain TUFC12733) TaxID=1330018 RepID=A0A167Q102_CALVF|nr:hypothetical protein CALVIDRAFT_377395 [Calocera viscosa TUFC12733]